MTSDTNIIQKAIEERDELLDFICETNLIMLVRAMSEIGHHIPDSIINYLGGIDEARALGISNDQYHADEQADAEYEKSSGK